MPGAQKAPQGRTFFTRGMQKMKKTYVKPTAECEEFVANEFVAACWDLRCYTPGCKYNDYKNRIGGDKYNYTDEDFLRCVNEYGKEDVIHGGDEKHWSLLGWENPDSYYHSGGVGHHKLTITRVPEDSAHPNSSN